MRHLIIFLFALSLPLGDQLNPILGFSVSNMFMAIVAIAVMFLPCIPNLSVKIPKAFKWFYIYAVLHTLLFYSIKYPGTLADLCEIEIYGNVVSDEPYYIILLRYFFYLLTPIAISIYISNEKYLKFFFKCFVICFIASMVISYSYNIIVLNSIRFSGGFHDPNTFGGFSLIALFSSLYLKGESRKRIYIALCIFFLACILISESRASLLGTVVGVLYLFLTGYINKRVFIVMSIIALIGIGYMISNDIGVVGRFSQIAEREGGDSRTLIWLSYLGNISNYWLTGTGIGHKFDAVEWMSSMRSTHNMYLLQLVQLGILGLILFLRTIYSTVHDMNSYTKVWGRFKPLAAIVCAFLALFFFSDYDNTREYAIIIAIYFICYKLNKKACYDYRHCS